MKKTIQLLVSGAKEVVWYLFQVAVLSGAVILGLKWSGDLLEPICEHINVGTGLFLLFAVIAAYIYIDNKNALEKKQDSSEQSRRREQVFR